MINFRKKSSPIYEEGEVDEIVQQGKKWRVRFRASFWSARSVRPLTLFPGDTVQIKKIGLPLEIDRPDFF